LNLAAWVLLRQALGLSQNQAAQRSGVSQSYLSEIERGVKVAGPATILKLAAGIGVPLAAIVTMSDEAVA